MKRFWTLLWILILFGGGDVPAAFAGKDDQCIQGFGGKIELRPSFVSAWGRSPDTANLHRRYRDLPLQAKSRNVLAPQAGSFSAKNPELEKTLEDLNTYMLHPSDYTARMKALGREVKSEAELRDFYENRLTLFESGIEAYAALVAKMDPALAFMIKSKIKIEIAVEKLELTEKLNTTNFWGYHRICESKANWMKAKLTELNALGSIHGVKGYSIHIGDTSELRLTLNTTIDDHKARLSRFPNHLEYLNQNFPLLLNNAYLRGLERRWGRPLKPAEILDAIGTWIRDKEIDLIYQVEGKLQWLEVKLNSEPLTLAKLEEVKGGKSYATQLKENLEIRRFLKLENKVVIRLYASGGVHPEVKALLESWGVLLFE